MGKLSLVGDSGKGEPQGVYVAVPVTPEGHGHMKSKLFFVVASPGINVSTCKNV